MVGAAPHCPSREKYHPNVVGYARPPRRVNDVMLGTDVIGADMLGESGLAYVAHRARRVRRSAGVDVAEVRAHAVEQADRLFGRL